MGDHGKKITSEKKQKLPALTLQNARKNFLQQHITLQSPYIRDTLVYTIGKYTSSGRSLSRPCGPLFSRPLRASVRSFIGFCQAAANSIVSALGASILSALVGLCKEFY